MVTCPSCGESDLYLAERFDDGGRRVRCNNCGYQWTRGGDSQRRPRFSLNRQPEEYHPPRIFKDDDAGFASWLERHPHGYVINTSRTPSPSYLMLHRADCIHISVPFSAGNRWTHDYIKV